MVVFLNMFKGKGKESGKEYCRVSLAEVTDDGKFYQKEFFIGLKNSVLVDKFADLVFGDIIDVEFAMASELSNRMEIVDVKRKVRSPYFEFDKGD